MKPYDLKINLLSAPYGVDKNKLTFSFAMGDEGENTKLDAVRLVVSQSLTDFEAKRYCYDSDFVVTNQNSGLCFSDLSQQLQDDSLYVCCLQTRSKKGSVSLWTKPLWFSTAHPSWHPTGVWAASDCDFCFLRKEFSLQQMPTKALLQVTARSPEKSRQYVYHLTCNGEFVGLGPARYGKTDDQMVLYYETIDITSHLHEGVNCLGAACYTMEDRRFAARLVTFDQNGNKTVMFDDACGFDGLDATAIYRPDGSIGTNYFPAHAENIDGEVYPYGWEQAGYEGDFAEVAPKTPMDDDLLLQPYPAPVVERVLTPVSRYETLADDTLFVDLGKEIIGGICVTAKLEQSADVTLRYGEELTEDGRVRYQMRTSNVYEEHWRLAAGEHTLTSIGMKTFRYVEIAGLPAEAEITVQGSAYVTPFDETASYFTSSSELLNEIYDLCKYTIRATNQNLYVDSQSRERCAYEGDVLINMLTAAGVQDCHALSRFSVDYLMTHRTWPAEYVLYCVLMVRADYEYTGDATLMAKQYEALKHNLYWDYYDPSVGLVRNITMAGNVKDAVLVDWPVSERDGYDYKNAMYNTVLNAVVYRALDDMAFMAGQLNKSDEQKQYGDLAQQLKMNMIRLLYDQERGCFVDGLADDGTPLTHAAQHATAFALYAGVYDSVAMQQALAEYLTAQGEIRMSVYGSHFLLEGLYQASAGAAANALLLNDDVTEGARTWAYMLDKLDATITSEAWNTKNKPNMTWSHPWGSAAGSAIVRGLFGIRPLTPGFADFSLRLQPSGLRYAAIQVPTVKGAITAAFDVTKPDVPLSLTVNVPANTTAHLSLPAQEGLHMTVNGDSVETNYQNGCYHRQLSSGQWLVELL